MGPLSRAMRVCRKNRIKFQLSDQELRELKALARYEKETVAQTIRVALRARTVSLVKSRTA
jgi:hypothetical protein